MCKTLYKYFLLTATSFGACGGLYLLCLTDWLWLYEPRVSEEKTDWRDVPKYSGLIGFIIFTPGVAIVVREKPKELQYYGIFLIIPFLGTLVCLILQMYKKVYVSDPTDWYLFGVLVALLAIIVNLFLFMYEINTYGSHHLISTSKQSEENVV